ncbi:MAG TPA: hypothetical protein VOA41_07055 [Candidatus Dormibacteraeota bacterium]|nr:hypothetical protein [Candidatus Dormibacteraeota bacterium]
MLLALVVLLFPAPPAHYATTDADGPKPAIRAAVRPLLFSKETSDAAPTETAAGVPEIPLTKSFPSDVPAIANMRHAEPVPPSNYFPESPAPRLAAGPFTVSNTFEAPIKPAVRAMDRESLASRRLWYGLLAAGHTAATFDAYSTRRVISRNTGTERNPLLRPFANSNSLYVAVQASPLLMDYLGRKMMKSESSWVRRMWWLPQSVGTAASLLSGVHNIRISQ